MKTLVHFSSMGNTLKAARFYDTSTSYYITDFVSLMDQTSPTSVQVTITQSSAAIMTDGYSQSCLSDPSETWDTDVALTVDSFTWEALDADDAFDGRNYFVEDQNSATLKDLDTTLIYPAWCTATVTIQASTYTSFSYTLFDASDTFTLDAFTTAEGCTDATFTYTLTDTGTSTALAAPWDWDSDTRVLDLGDLVETQVGTWTIEVTGTLD